MALYLRAEQGGIDSRAADDSRDFERIMGFCRPERCVHAATARDRGKAPAVDQLFRKVEGVFGEPIRQDVSQLVVAVELLCEDATTEGDYSSVSFAKIVGQAIRYQVRGNRRECHVSRRLVPNQGEARSARDSRFDHRNHSVTDRAVQYRLTDRIEASSVTHAVCGRLPEIRFAIHALDREGRDAVEPARTPHDMTRWIGKRGDVDRGTLAPGGSDNVEEPAIHLFIASWRRSPETPCALFEPHQVKLLEVGEV